MRSLITAPVWRCNMLKRAICLLFFSFYGYQLWFPVGSPSISGALMTKVLVAVYIQFISLLVVVIPSQLLWSYASCLMPSFPKCSCHCSASFWLPNLCHCLCWFTTCPLFLALQPLIYNDLEYACWDNLSVLLHARIACRVLHLYAGIVCLAFLACDWLFPIGAYQVCLL